MSPTNVPSVGSEVSLTLTSANKYGSALKLTWSTAIPNPDTIPEAIRKP